MRTTRLRRLMAAALASAFLLTALNPAEARKRRRRDQPGGAEPAAAPATAAPTEAGPLTAEQATGTSTWSVRLEPVARLGGVGLVITWDPSKVLVGEPRPTDALRGYMCQSNIPKPGELRWSCVGLVGEPRGGEIGQLDVRWKDAPPGPDALKLAQVDLADDQAQPLPSVKVELAPAPQPAPR